MAKVSENKTGSSKYVSLKVFGKRRMFLFFTVVSMTGFFGFLLTQNLMRDREQLWLHAGLPIIAVSLIAVFLPLSEEWNYAPWQDASQRCEKSTYT